LVWQGQIRPFNSSVAPYNCEIYVEFFENVFRDDSSYSNEIDGKARICWHYIQKSDP